MSEATKSGEDADTGQLPDVSLVPPDTKPDYATIVGIIAALSVIAIAIWMGKSDASFINAPSFFIVVLGTMAATSISFTVEELARSWVIIRKSMVRRIYSPTKLAETLLSLAVVAKKKGILSLVNYDAELKKDPFLHHAMQLVVDGYQPEEIERLLTLEINAQQERHKRAASITRRASEIAPAMGLLGTVVGLVQMLADLENPEVIGPAMAVALITTFYGSILGSVIMAPMAVKLEKNSHDERLVKTVIVTAAASIARLENPRRLEMLLNADLPPSEQIKYFD